MSLHVRGRGLPDEQSVEWWIVDERSRDEHGHRGTLSAEPVSGAETVFDGGWILPGLVDAHCHVGLGADGPVDLDEAITQAATERDVGALLLRDCGSPVDTRSLDHHDDLPRIIRAGRHLARPKRYSRGLAIELEDESGLPDAVAAAGPPRRRLGQARRRLDRPRHRRLGAVVVRRRAHGGDRRRPRPRCTGDRSRVRRRCAARPGEGRHRLHRTRHRDHRRRHRHDGRSRHRAGPDPDQCRKLPRHRRRRGEISRLRRAHA